MNITTIRIIKEIARGTSEPNILREIVGIKEWQLNAQLKDLNRSGILQKENNEIKFLDGLKPTILKELSDKYNLEKILRGANETVFSHMIDAVTVNDITRETDLSQSTAYRAISDLESIGVISRRGDLFQVKGTDPQITMLANILKTERTNTHDTNAEIIYNDPEKTLKKVLRGKITEGEQTAFSLFTEYGIEYHTNNDYYIKQDEPLTIQHVLMHALFDAQKRRDKIALTMAIIFYLKHKDKMDILELRIIAESFKIINVWLDVENYIRSNGLRNPEYFLPREEFIEKANLYDISPDMYTLPEAYPKLFQEIGKKLPMPITACLIGGENMRIKGLKPRTKDLDIVVEDSKDFNALVSVLAEIGYKPKAKTEYSKEKLRVFPSTTMIHPSRSTVDLYTKKILRMLSLSESMIQRADTSDFHKLRLKILKNEDILVLKAVTSREGEIQDMFALASLNYIGEGQFRQRNFDWDIVWEEIMNQEKIDETKSFTETIQDSLEYLREQYGITAPFRNKLRRFVLDKNIGKLLREGKTILADIVKLLIDYDNSEQAIRNRITALVKNEILKKEYVGKEILVSLVQTPIYPAINLKITPENLEEYLIWKFPTREQDSAGKYRILADELNFLNLNAIGELDAKINIAIENMKKYEKTYHKKSKLTQIGAVRISIGLTMPGIARKGLKLLR